MKKLLMLCCLVFGIHTISCAQLSRSTANQADGQKLSASLSKNQKAKISAIYAKQHNDMQVIIKSSHGNQAEMNKKIMVLMNSTTEKVRAILTPAQAVIYKRLMQQNQPRMVKSGR